MKILPFALLVLFVLADASAVSRAQDPEKPMWWASEESGDQMLSYGTDNVEDVPISFACTPGKGIVNVWINETDRSVKANRSMTASLIAGATTAKVKGKTMPNEEAGTPSFEGTMPASDPLFATLSKEQKLVFMVGKSRSDVPLKDIGDKADKFIRLCQKK